MYQFIGIILLFRMNVAHRTDKETTHLIATRKLRTYLLYRLGTKTYPLKSTPLPQKLEASAVLLC